MTWLEGTHDLGDILIPTVMAGGLTLYILSFLRRAKERNALAERRGLASSDDLPQDFPQEMLAGFRKWRADDILAGYRGKEFLLTFDCSFKRWWQKQRTDFTVVAIRTGRHYPQPSLREGVSYYEIGSWRIAVAMGFFDLYRRKLSVTEIETLWDRLIS